MNHSIHATDQPLNRELGISWANPTSIRSKLAEINVNYQVQRDWNTGKQTGYYCCAPSLLRKGNTIDTVAAFIHANRLPLELVEGSGLTFFIHNK